MLLLLISFWYHRLPPFLLHKGDRSGDPRHLGKSTGRQVPPSNLFTMILTSKGMSWVTLCTSTPPAPPKESLHTPQAGPSGRGAETTHRFHSVSLEKLESLQADDLMSQVSHAPEDDLHGAGRKGQESSRGLGRATSPECSPCAGGLSRHVQGHSQAAALQQATLGLTPPSRSAREG